MPGRTKRVLPDRLDLDDAQAMSPGRRSQAASHGKPFVPSRSKVAMEDGRGGLKEKAVATTLYLLPEDHRRLRRMAIDRGISFQTLMLDAIDMLLMRENENPVGRWDTRRKVR